MLLSFITPENKGRYFMMLGHSWYITTLYYIYLFFAERNVVNTQPIVHEHWKEQY